MKTSTLFFGASLLALLGGPAMAQSSSATPENSAKPAKEADKMKSGDTAGSAPNSSNPGASPGADGNAAQDSRTTKTKER